MDALSTRTSPERPSKRQRARKACFPCRKRKRKCDSNYPCSMCTTYGYGCQYPPDEGPSAPFVDQSHHVEEKARIPEHESCPAPPQSLDNHGKEKEGSRPPEAADRGILDPVKGRYMGLHSVVAFPRSLGLDLQSQNPPHLHSFAWNCGIRTEAISPPHRDLRAILIREDFDRLIRVYFDTVHPIFGILERDMFMMNSNRFWDQLPSGIPQNKTTSFDAVLAGVLALGSFFSASQGHQHESDFVSHAKNLLEDPNHYRLSSINLVTAQVLRTIYLRATTRPHASWLSSSTAVHLAEATGIHRELDSVVLTSEQCSGDSGKSSDASNGDGKRTPRWEFGRRRGDYEVTRRLFWSAWALNKMISYEYGRSSVTLTRITTRLPREIDGDFSYWHIRLAMIIPGARPGTDDNSGTNLSPDHTTKSLLQAFEQIEQIPDSHPYVTLSKGDLALCIYRRLRLLSPSSASLSSFSPNICARILAIGNVVLSSAVELTKRRHFWWQVLCTTFQYLCVLLAIDTFASLSQIQNAMETLDEICTVLGTHVSNEARHTAKLLLRDAMKKKRGELELLEKAGEVNGRVGVLPDDNEIGVDREGQVREEENWYWEVEDVNWDALLDPGITWAGFRVEKELIDDLE